MMICSWNPPLSPPLRFWPARKRWKPQDKGPRASALPLQTANTIPVPSFSSTSFFTCVYLLNSIRGVQHTTHRLHATQDGYECSPTQNRKFTENITIFFAIMCRNVFNDGPRQLFLFQCDTEMPKCWTPCSKAIGQLAGSLSQANPLNLSPKPSFFWLPSEPSLGAPVIFSVLSPSLFHCHQL